MPFFCKTSKSAAKATSKKDLPLPLPLPTVAEDIVISRDKEIADIISASLIKISSIIQSNVKIQSGDVVELVANVMELVERLNRNDLELKGADKAYIAVQIASRSLDLIPGLNDSQKADIRILIPNMIEIIIKATQGGVPVDGTAPLRTDSKFDTVALAKKLYDRLKLFIIEKKFDAQSISTSVVILIGYLISIINEYQNISMLDKKLIVRQTIQYLTMDLRIIFPDISDDNLRIAQVALGLAPNIIDSIILAASGLFDINKIKETASKCYAKCCVKK